MTRVAALLVRIGFVVALLAGLGIWAGIISASAPWAVGLHIAAGLAVVAGIVIMAGGSGAWPARARWTIWMATVLVVGGALIGAFAPVHRDPWLGAGHLAVMVVAVALAEMAKAIGARVRS